MSRPSRHGQAHKSTLVAAPELSIAPFAITRRALSCGNGFRDQKLHIRNGSTNLAGNLIGSQLWFHFVVSDYKYSLKCASSNFCSCEITVTQRNIRVIIYEYFCCYFFFCCVGMVYANHESRSDYFPAMTNLNC